MGKPAADLIKWVPREAGKRATLAELSAYLGLSKATLSRALNDYPDISEATKARTRAAAKKLGYKASSSARRLSAGKAETIGLVTPLANTGLRSAYQSEFMNALALGLSRFGHDLLLHVVDKSESEVEAYARLAQEGKVDGFVVMRSQVADPRIDFLRDNQIPFVTQGRFENDEDQAWLDVDAEEGFYQMTSFLVQLGHKAFGYLKGDPTIYSSALRQRGVERALAEAGLTLTHMFQGDYSASAGERTADQIISQSLDLSAVICANDAMAMGLVSRATKLGLQIPHSLSVTGYDGVRIAEMFNPPITTLSHSAAECGADMASMIVGLIQGQDPKGLQKLVPPALIPRGSTAIAKGGSTHPPKGLI